MMPTMVEAKDLHLTRQPPSRESFKLSYRKNPSRRIHLNRFSITNCSTTGRGSNRVEVETYRQKRSADGSFGVRNLLVVEQSSFQQLV